MPGRPRGDVRWGCQGGTDCRYRRVKPRRAERDQGDGRGLRGREELQVVGRAGVGVDNIDSRRPPLRGHRRQRAPATRSLPPTPSASCSPWRATSRRRRLFGRVAGSASAHGVRCGQDAGLTGWARWAPRLPVARGLGCTSVTTPSSPRRPRSWGGMVPSNAKRGLQPPHYAYRTPAI
jgi:hypothetical protein